MAPPRGQFGNRLDTEAGRQKEAQMAAAAAAAQRGDANAAAMAAAIPNAPVQFTQAIQSTIQQATPTFTPLEDLSGVGREGPSTDIYGQPKVPGGNYLGGPFQGTAAQEPAEDPTLRASASAFLAGILRQFGMEGMMGQIDSLIQSWGTASEVIVEKLRQTPEYQQRFKGLIDLRARGITDIANEGDYIRLESSYRRIFRDNNIQSFLGEPGSQAERDKIARLVGDFSLSIDEVEERIIDARRVVADTPQEVRDSLQRFYNITPELMLEFVLDPETTSTVIQRRANAAIVGGFAQRAGLDFGVDISERVGEFLGGDRNLRGTEIEPQLTEIADIQRSTQRLAEIERGTLSAEESALSALNLDQQARERVRTLQSRERARFGGSTAITTQSLAQARQI